MSVIKYMYNVALPNAIAFCANMINILFQPINVGCYVYLNIKTQNVLDPINKEYLYIILMSVYGVL